jgi:hypothetical protein
MLSPKPGRPGAQAALLAHAPPRALAWGVAESQAHRAAGPEASVTDPAPRCHLGGASITTRCGPVAHAKRQCWSELGPSSRRVQNYTRHSPLRSNFAPIGV